MRQNRIPIPPLPVKDFHPIEADIWPNCPLCSNSLGVQFAIEDEEKDEWTCDTCHVQWLPDGTAGQVYGRCACGHRTKPRCPTCGGTHRKRRMLRKARKLQRKLRKKS